MILIAFLLAVSTLQGADYSAPAGTRPTIRRPGAESILPNGRLITPLGLQYHTGPGPFGLAISPGGTAIATADGGPGPYSITVLLRSGIRWDSHHLMEEDAHSVSMGLVFDGDHTLYASSGNSGCVRQILLPAGKVEQVYDLNQQGFTDSFTGDLAIDRARGLLYVVDQANFRVVIIDVRNHHVLSSVRVGRLPFAIAVSPEGGEVYVTNIGMFEYKSVPDTDPKRVRESAMFFPAYGFPSPEALRGVQRMTATGPVQAPELGNPNAPESNSLAIVDVRNPLAPKVERFLHTGLPVGEKSCGGSGPSGVLAAGGRIYVANAHNDSITVVDAATRKVLAEIPIRIPGLEAYRGVLPMGMSWHEPTGWLLVAEAGINAIGVIDTRTFQVIGHLPVGWFPTRVAVDRNLVYVSNAKGHGTGPNGDQQAAFEDSFQDPMHRGSISIFPFPPAEDLRRHTARVIQLNGFRPSSQAASALPAQIRHVVVIVKESRSFDEVFGDLDSASNGRVDSAPMLARFSRYGMITPSRGAGQSRAPLRNVNVTPNHHEMAARWAFSDNFYADAETRTDGHHWMVGAYPDAWIESTVMSNGKRDFRLPTKAPGRWSAAQDNASLNPEEQLEAGTLWQHLERHHIPFRNFGEGFDLAGTFRDGGEKPTGARYLTNVPMPDALYRNTSHDYPGFNTNIPDQYRATQFINEIEQLFVKGGQAFPRLIFVHLPNDHTANPRPEDGYPFKASYVADNDDALGRIVEYLSHTPWWKQMAILVTESNAHDGADHVDSHRTVLLVASPYAKKNYVSHTHSSFPGLLKTTFRLLGIPPLNLYDATATDLSDCFTTEPDFTPYTAEPVDPYLFDPSRARDPFDPLPGPFMGDPRILR
jgi:YVTN family beta-propeller protein